MGDRGSGGAGASQAALAVQYLLLFFLQSLETSDVPLIGMIFQDEPYRLVASAQEQLIFGFVIPLYIPPPLGRGFGFDGAKVPLTLRPHEADAHKGSDLFWLSLSFQRQQLIWYERLLFAPVRHKPPREEPYTVGSPALLPAETQTIGRYSTKFAFTDCDDARSMGAEDSEFWVNHSEH